MTKKNILRRVWDRCLDLSDAAFYVMHVLNEDLKYIEETEKEVARLRDERFEDYARRQELLEAHAALIKENMALRDELERARGRAEWEFAVGDRVYREQDPDRYATVLRLSEGRVEIRYDDMQDTYLVFPQAARLRRFLPEGA
jgi:hypothetical protein